MAKKDKWSKFGSSYDPNHSGNNKKRGESPADRIQTYNVGCGDPDCTECGGRTVEVSFSGLRDEALTNFFQIYRSGNYSSKLAGSPPQSYLQARESVKKYLCPVPDEDFENIIGNAQALFLLKEAIQAPVLHKEVYEAYGMKMPKGALLSGPPGCGKTMFAKAAAAEMKRLYGKKGDFEFLSLSGGELQQSYVGQTEALIRSLFVFAREYQKYHGYPLLIFIDEAEVILPDRTGRVRHVMPWEESQVSTFLTELDGMRESGAFLLLATNRPEVIDQAVLRDGRCDFKITVKRPNRQAIEQIITRNFQGSLIKDKLEDLVFAAVEFMFDQDKILLDCHALGMSHEGEIKEVAQKHFLFEDILSGAMAASVPQRAARHAFSRDKASGKAEGITVRDVQHAIDDLWEENRKLEHSFALQEFRENFMTEVHREQKGRLH